MKIKVTEAGISPNEALRLYAKHRVRTATVQYAIHIKSIGVDISVAGNPLNGAEKQCRVQVRLVGRRDVIEKDVACDVYEAINRAAKRVSRTLALKLGRRPLDE
jgi:ribosome-associated translation inhibitor RaiA